MKNLDTRLRLVSKFFTLFFRLFHSNSEKSTQISCNFTYNCAPAYTHTTLMISQSNVKYDNFINPYFIYMLCLYLALALACMWLLITVHLHTISYYLLLAFTRKSSEEVKCWKYSQRYIKFFYLEYWSLVMRRF